MPLLYLYLHQVCSDVSPSTNPEDTLLFTSAALSVLNMGSKKTSSGVLINQLMAFAAVSGSIMSPDLVIGNLCRSPGAVLQLESVRQVWRDANAILPHTQTEHPGMVEWPGFGCGYVAGNEPQQNGHQALIGLSIVFNLLPLTAALCCMHCRAHAINRGAVLLACPSNA